ncbi:hypothetical protein AVEN_150870-1 [Araneus ventricosus]|uniref:Uncharacterized protein n=1 Tax=Araneus ventricosus TaxID=182803 RepID=A0A4Y2KF15_ARAVE|nr:hypothetical protein AVEN_150870-1 [Araneus ventricosus]
MGRCNSGFLSCERVGIICVLKFYESTRGLCPSWLTLANPQEDCVASQVCYCYSHGKSLPSNASLMVGKRVLQGEAWSDLSDSFGTHDLGDHFGDLARNLATLATNR